MKHYYGLMNFKKAFKEAQHYHAYAIHNGNEETKQKHVEHHIKGGTSHVLVQRPGNTNNKQGW